MKFKQIELEFHLAALNPNFFKIYFHKKQSFLFFFSCCCQFNIATEPMCLENKEPKNLTVLLKKSNGLFSKHRNHRKKNYRCLISFMLKWKSKMLLQLWFYILTMKQKWVVKKNKLPELLESVNCLLSPGSNVF